MANTGALTYCGEGLDVGKRMRRVAWGGFVRLSEISCTNILTALHST